MGCNFSKPGQVTHKNQSSNYDNKSQSNCNKNSKSVVDSKSETTDSSYCKLKDRNNVDNKDSKSLVGLMATNSNNASSSEKSAIDQSVFVQKFKAYFKDRYINLKKLGSGAFGQVVQCRCIDSEEIRAIKIIKKNKVKLSSNATILYELNVVKQLDHPNIMKVYEFFEDDDNYYIVMEVYSGGELFDAIINRKKFTEIDAAKIMKQILSGITYLHKNHIVHRDLKPENLLLENNDPEITIKIIDFGLSTFITPNTKMEERLGTVYYIAPEVLKQKYDEKCDVWSAGVIMYILLSGYPPFSGKRDEDIFAKIEKGKYTYDYRFWSNISTEAKDLIDKMLTYDSEHRITAEAALNHPWILNSTASDETKIQNQSLVTALGNMREFQASQKLARAALLFMGSKLTKVKETKELTDIFSSLDENGDGQLDREELIHGFFKLKKLKSSYVLIEDVETEVDKILEYGDFDNNGFIDYSEFITVAMDKKVLLSEERLKSAFKMFDKDDSGKIAAEELKKILVNIDPNQIDEIISQVDLNNDSEIDFQEFVSMMQKLL